MFLSPRECLFGHSLREENFERNFTRTPTSISFEGKMKYSLSVAALYDYYYHYYYLQSGLDGRH